MLNKKLIVLLLCCASLHAMEEGEEQALTQAIEKGNTKAVFVLLQNNHSMTEENRWGTTSAQELYFTLCHNTNICALQKCSSSRCFTACLAALVKCGLPLRSTRGLYLCNQHKGTVEASMHTQRQYHEHGNNHFKRAIKYAQTTIDLDRVGFAVIWPEERALKKENNKLRDIERQFEEAQVMHADTLEQFLEVNKKDKARYTELEQKYNGLLQQQSTQKVTGN